MCVTRRDSARNGRISSDVAESELLGLNLPVHAAMINYSLHTSLLTLACALPGFSKDIGRNKESQKFSFQQILRRHVTDDHFLSFPRNTRFSAAPGQYLLHRTSLNSTGTLMNRAWQRCPIWLGTSKSHKHENEAQQLSYR